MARMFFGGRGGGRGGGGGSGGSAGAAVQPVQVSTDPRTNAVVVTASQDQLALIDRLVAELDADPDPVVTEIRPFPLENADAESLAETLTALFEEPERRTGGGQQDQGLPPFLRRMLGRGGGGGGGGRGRQASVQSTSDRYSPKPKFTTDERTNTLIASATTQDLEVIAALVKQLDEDPTEATSVLVLQLKHADAAKLAQILTDSLSESASSGGGGGGGGGAGNRRRNRPQQRQAGRQPANAGSSLGGLVGEVTVVADEEANALVFTSSERNFDRLREVVSRLDQPRREVFIECLIAEVQLNDKGELGIQWNALFTNSAENAKEGSQSLGTDFGLDSLTDGLRYTTTSDQFTGLLRALQTEGRLNILSSPKILCLENQAAEISVGQEVPFVTNSRITNQGDTVNTIQYRDVGIILRVEPQINSDGHVRMTVHPEVSSIAPDSQSVPISDGVRSPTFNKNFADTTIVIKTGETAIIGGLIRDELSETEFKIPFLGDIPILGKLFGSTSREKVKQEIVVFLTPHVVERPGELRSRSARTLEEYAFVPNEVVRNELDRWLRGLERETHAFHYNRGTVLLEAGRLEAAIRELRKATRLDGGDPAAHFNLALALGRAGRLEAAKAELRQAALLDPSDPEIPYNMGALLWRQGDYPRAAALFQRALELDPLHESARHWLSRALEEIRRLERELLEEGPAPREGADPREEKKE
ncbi:MAG: type II secretion system protein GspD [Planctomycetota bacterium]|nr:MAG: type II secretion system protein GspD [Planctomycetota bacterium]